MERQESSFIQRFVFEPPETYHSTSAVKSSGIRIALACPEKYHYRYLSGEFVEKESKALVFGRLMHMALLEPVRTRERIRVGPANAPRNTTIGKMKWDEFHRTLAPDAIVMEAKEADVVVGMINRILRDQYAPRLFSGGVAERSGYFLDESTALWCAFRPDYLVEHESVVDIYDYKTAREVSYLGFQRDIHNRGYEVQAAHYVAGATAITGKRAAFHWVAQEKEPPFTIAIYTATTSLLEIGEYKRRKGLDTISRCIQSGVWPGYCDGPTNMAAAKWAEWQQFDDEQEDLNG